MATALTTTTPAAHRLIAHALSARPITVRPEK
jgi:hypothetical protein